MFTDKERLESLESLNQLKITINLAEFACHKFGYIPDWLHPSIKRGNVKSSANSIKLIHKENVMDAILIGKNNKNDNFVYRSLFKNDDNGTIVDFVKNRVEDFSIAKLRKMCKNYEQGIEKGFFANVGINVRKYENNQDELNHEAIAFSTLLKPLTNSDYLISRAIDKNIQEKYLGKAFNHVDEKNNLSIVLPYYTVLDSPNSITNKQVSLYTYQKYSDDDIIKKKFINGPRSNSIWMNAGAFNFEKKITALVVSESPLDAISFAALHPKKCGSNPILTATGGNMPYGISHTYHNILTVSKCNNVILANDNDCEGQRYNAKFLSELSCENLVDKDFLNSHKVLLEAELKVYKDEYKGFLEWKFYHDKLDESKKGEKLTDLMQVFVDVKDYYVQLNHDLKGVLDEKEVFKVETFFGKDNVSEIKLEFKNSKENWEQINESLLWLKFGNSEKINIEVSHLKDFNDDLKFEKGLIKKDINEEQKENKSIKI